MAMAFLKLTASLEVFKRNDYKYFYDPGVLVDHLVDPEH